MHYKERRALQLRIEELETICAESYIVVGALADKANVFDLPAVQNALDNLSQTKHLHKDVLPFTPDN